MDESLLYISDSGSGGISSAGLFAHSVSLHNHKDYASFRDADCSRHAAAVTGVGKGEHLFVASSQKAVLNVYSWGKEGIDQRIPLPEIVSCLAICPQTRRSCSIEQSSGNTYPALKVPYLLAAGSPSGKIYLWEISSGNLLAVKEAHYQRVNVLKFSDCGSFLVTGADDARCIVWKVADLLPSLVDGLLTTNNSKPYAVFTENTLAITDIKLSDTGLINDVRIVTTSKDNTVRMYNLFSKVLLSTFVLSGPVSCVAIDPACRQLYVGLEDGLIRAIPLYNVNKTSLSIEAVCATSRIITIKDDPELRNTFVCHKLSKSITPANQSSKLKDTNTNSSCSVTCLELSSDGSVLASGDSLGRVYASDVFSKQILKTFPTSNFPISYIKTSLHFNIETGNLVNHKSKNNTHYLVPPLKRVMISENPLEHHIYCEVPGRIEEKEEFSSWIERKAEEEMNFKNFGMLNSTVTVQKNISQDLNDNSNVKLKQISKSYNDLKIMYESLLEEHTKLVNSTK